MSESHFKVLGLDEPKDENDFDESGLKKAFLGKVRSFPPHKHPEKYKVIRQAYECLNSSSERKAYIKNLISGGQITALQQKIDDCFSSERWSDAIATCKQLIVLDSDNYSARNQLALAFGNSGNLNEASKVYEKLNSFDHGVSLYHYNHGITLLELAIKTDQTSFAHQARKEFELAININPESSESYIGIARVQLQLKDFDSCVSWCDKAVNADGETDFQDFDAYFLKCQILSFEGSQQSFNNAVNDIELILDEDSVDYAAGLFAQNANDLAFRHHDLKSARLFSKASVKFLNKFNSINQPILDLHEAVVYLDKLRIETDRITNKSDINIAVQQLVRITFLNELGVIDKDEANRDFNEINEALEAFPISDVEKSFRYLKNNCPTTYKEIKEYVDNILELCGGGDNYSSQSSSHNRPTRSATSQETQSGCLFFFVIVAVAAYSFISYTV